MTAVHGPFGYLIQAGTRSPFSHIDLIAPAAVVEEFSDVLPHEDHAIGALYWRGVTARPVGKAKSRAYRIGHMMFRVPDEHKFWKNAFDLIGTPYDRWAIVGIGTNQRNLQSASKLICSEYADVCFRHVGVVVQNEISNMITPRDIWISPTAVTRWVEKGEVHV